MPLSKVLVFASGGKEKGKGGSGLRHLILNMLAGMLNVEIVGIVSNYEHGGVCDIADEFGLRFFHLASAYTAEKYQAIASETGAEWFLLSGWLKFVRGLPASRTINIHPGPTRKPFGGEGMHGEHVHQALVNAKVTDQDMLSAVTMHFVTEKFDEGLTFFEYSLWVLRNDTADTFGTRVNRYEHSWQSFVTWLVVSGQIHWDGVEGYEVVVPNWYRKIPFCPRRLQTA